MQVFGINPFIVLSGSMEPAIQTGSICFVDTRATYDNIKAGDIIAFKAGRVTLVTHRISVVTDAGLVTKRDANKVSDGLSATEDNFVGRTLFSIPYAGYCSKALQSSSGKTVLGIAVAVILLSIFISIRKEDKVNKQQ